MSWESPPVHRHLSTIGIGPVFVCPPPYPLLQPQQLDEEVSTDVSEHDDDGLGVSPSEPNHGNEILTWEIAGDIKTTPEDFIVREIGWAPTRLPTHVEHHTDRNNESEERNVGAATQTKSAVVWSRKIAGLECDYPTTSDADVHGVDSVRDNDNDVITKNERPPDADEKMEPNCLSLNNLQDELTPSPPNSQHETELEYFTCSDPTEGLRRILIASITNDSDMTESLATQEEGEIASAAILKELADLQNVALDEIDSASSAKIDSHTNDDKSVWISISKLDKDSRALLHRYIRQSFPLLCTETSSARPSDERMGDGAIDTIGTNNDDHDITAKESSPNIKNWVCALIDRAYFSIAPCLVNPRQDLLALYKFRHYGPVAVLSEDGNRISKTGVSRHGSNDKNDTSPRRINSISQGVVYLRLRHDLPKIDRRAIHQALASSRRREFETSTIHDVPSDDADKDSILTTAIVVQWSNQALKSLKKRKRKEEDNNTTINNSQSEQNHKVTAIFCVLRKYQCEHQVAISSIVRALKCRAGDIGLAGIKDMKAITYQFCTLRGVDVKRIHRANRLLGNRIQLVNMMEVHGSDSLLDRGKLIGSECTS